MSVVQPTLDLNDEKVLAVLAAEAKAAYERGAAGLSEADLYQIAFTWMMRHPLYVQRWAFTRDAPEKIAPAVREYLRAKVIERKAGNLGYDVSDLAWYSPGVLKNLLPQALSEDGLHNPPDDGASRTKGDPATGGNLTVMLIDVRKAFSRLNGYHATWLHKRYVDGWDVDAIASSWNVDTSIVEQSLNESLRLMTEVLGGTHPRGCSYDCECKEKE